MGNIDSKQKLGEKVTASRKKLQECSKLYSQRSNEFNAKSSKMSQYMIDNIAKCFKHCSPFFEPTLLTAWYSNPTKCEEIVLNSCRKVLNSPIISKQWEWFQRYVFPSSIWMFKSTQKRNRFMYEELLDIANTYSNDITESMDSIYDSLLHQKGWKELMNIKNETFISRQDDKKVGLLKENAIIDIKEAKSDQDYEMQTFVDSNWCINSLLSTAQIINNEFQNHIKTVTSHYGKFKAGPLKKIDRCQNKMENDYLDATFPKAAKLLDIIRCSVTFNTLQQLIKGYNGLMNHIKYNKSILEIARIKNRFLDKNDGGYRDVKINVVYHSPVTGQSMICEVQLLLVNYLWEKKRVHKLYNVNRQELYFKLVVTEEQKSEQKSNNAKDLKLVPVFKFDEDIKKKVDKDNLFKCSIDSELDLLAVRGRRWFGCLSLKTNKIIFEQHVDRFAGLKHSHHWINVNGRKYLTVQTHRNIIKMFKVNNYTFEEDQSMQIKVADSKNINLIEFDRNYQNAFLIVDKKELQQRMINDINNVKMKIELQEMITGNNLRQLCLADNGECCVIGGGTNKKHFYYIDLKKQRHHKLTSNVLDSTFAPCFINGESKYVVVGDSVGKIEIWDVMKKASFKVIDGFNKYVGCAMSTNNILAVVSGDKKIKLWDVRTWDMFYEGTFNLTPLSLHLTSDAKYLTIGGMKGEMCLVWKIE